MCGITGIAAFNEIGRVNMGNLERATSILSSRGPDDHGTYYDDYVGLGHRRLSIIDTSPKGHQPMQIPEGRFVITFNGEIYNYRALKKELIDKGVRFYTETDTEVLLQLYTLEGKECLKRLNGFFAFAIYDTKEKSLFIARDRMGIKPLVYFLDEDKLLFASEIKSIAAYGLNLEINPVALNAYFQLNYIPAPLTALQNIHKLPPGHFMEVKAGTVHIEKYYQIPESSSNRYSTSYQNNQKKLIELMEDAVSQRLVSDVPLGAFLSGGIDSSVIVAMASRQVSGLHTFSIGYKDEPFFDETHYARLVAKKFRTEHTVFSLTTDDLYAHLEGITDYFDEPFADSSAIPVNILSRETAKHMTVALSGDGADEIFSGYNKHSGWLRSESGDLASSLIKRLHPLTSRIPKSRSNPFANKIRQLEKFGKGMGLSRAERYWMWACISSQEECHDLFHPDLNTRMSSFEEYKHQWLKEIKHYRDFNDFLRNDTSLVLPNDMLAKVDLMSMANSLEVRVPFLDHRVVDLAFSLPPDHKINGKMRKKILQDTFRSILPKELYRRPKKGFEVPLLKWMRRGLGNQLDDLVFNKDWVQSQGLFDHAYLLKMRGQLHSSNPGDVHARIWALFVFQKWYKKYLAS